MNNFYLPRFYTWIFLLVTFYFSYKPTNKKTKALL